MKKKMALLALAATAWLGTTANTPVTRSVENPFIESTNTMTLDISKVELRTRLRCFIRTPTSARITG